MLDLDPTLRRRSRGGVVLATPRGKQGSQGGVFKHLVLAIATATATTTNEVKAIQMGPVWHTYPSCMSSFVKLASSSPSSCRYMQSYRQEDIFSGEAATKY